MTLAIGPEIWGVQRGTVFEIDHKDSKMVRSSHRS